MVDVLYQKEYYMSILNKKNLAQVGKLGSNVLG